MKKFIIKAFILAVIIAAVDVWVGMAMTGFQKHAKGGDTKRMETIVDELEDDMVILGSSRALSHYDPIILQDSLGVSCYNAGRNRNGIIYNYGQHHLMTAHHVPKILIYDIQLDFDLLEDDKTIYLDWLKRYYDRPGIDSLFWDIDNTLRIKMLSQMYRYNGSFVQFIADNIRPMHQDVKGYRPFDSTMEYEPVADSEEETVYRYDSLKLKYWQRFISECKHSGTTLIFALSPWYKADESDVSPHKPIMDLAEKNGIPFIIHYADTAFSSKRNYFKDTVHLNREGATEYTKAIVKEIRQLLPECN